jgi:hypothetical protein
VNLATQRPGGVRMAASSPAAGGVKLAAGRPSGQKLMLQKCYSNNKTAFNEVLKTFLIIKRINKNKKSL